MCGSGIYMPSKNMGMRRIRNDGFAISSYELGKPIEGTAVIELCREIGSHG
jgi:hypothetical protein